MKALIFDLDGTLVDTVYGHALSWQRALAEAGIEADAARLHRRIGMAGELLVDESAREAGRKISDAKARAADERHAELFARLVPKPRPLEGAVELLPSPPRCTNSQFFSQYVEKNTSSGTGCSNDAKSRIGFSINRSDS